MARSSPPGLPKTLGGIHPGLNKELERIIENLRWLRTNLQSLTDTVSGIQQRPTTTTTTIVSGGGRTPQAPPAEMDPDVYYALMAEIARVSGTAGESAATFGILLAQQEILRSEISGLVQRLESIENLLPAAVAPESSTLEERLKNLETLIQIQ